MIIFIAMVLVAGIVAYVILSTGQQLGLRSSRTGSQTLEEVATGIEISTIEGHNTSGLIDKIVIIVTLRSGSPSIDLDDTRIEISDTNNKCVLSYSSTYWVNGTVGVSNIFSKPAFSSVASEYGVIVLKDDDYSCTSTSPLLTRDDHVMLALNTTAIFGGITENVNVFGNVIPEEGSWAIIQFRTPSAFADPVLMLQED
ncbi:MAG: flagellin [Candidatus Thermoplasmatota archaeon]|nr:flagellin [Candidatus Thermoplasmatota archaeon]